VTLIYIWAVYRSAREPLSPTQSRSNPSIKSFAAANETVPGSFLRSFFCFFYCVDYNVIYVYAYCIQVPVTTTYQLLPARIWIISSDALANTWHARTHIMSLYRYSLLQRSHRALSRAETVNFWTKPFSYSPGNSTSLKTRSRIRRRRNNIHTIIVIMQTRRGPNAEQFNTISKTSRECVLNT